MTLDPYNLDLNEVRRRLGAIWGLERDLTRAELARALDLSPKHGGDYIAKVEKGATLAGPSRVAICMMLEGARPYTMAKVIKPGYPRFGPKKTADAAA